MTPIGIQLRLEGERQVEIGLSRVSGAMDGVGSAATAITRAMGGLAGAFAGAISVREFVQAADAVTSLQNQLKLATGSAQAAGTAYNELYAIAQRSRTGFIELGQTFASISTAAADLGVSQQRLLTVTEAIGNAVTISGTGAQAAQAALAQLGQGLASGTLRGEELNSVMEQTPRLAKALADGLGISRGELRALGAQGAITAEQVIKALESQAGVLQGEVKDATLTVGQAFTQLKNASVAAVGDFDKASGASTALATSVGALAGAVGGLGGVIRENEGAFRVLGGVLAGGTLAAGYVAVAKGIGYITTAVGGLSAALAAGGSALAGLLGLGGLAVGAGVAGGVLALVEVHSRTADGITQAIDRLRGENERSEAAMARAMAGGRIAGAENIARTIEARRDQIAKLRAELDAMNGASAGAGGGRGSVNPDTVGAVAARQSANTKAINDYLGQGSRQSDAEQRESEIAKARAKNAEMMAKAEGDVNLQLKLQAALKNEIAAIDAKHKGKGGDRANAEASAYGSLISSIRSKIEADKLELAGGAALTESQRIRIKLDQDLAAGRIRLGSANEKNVRLALEELQASEASVRAAQEAIKASNAVAAARVKESDGIEAWIQAQEDAAQKSLESVRDRIAGLQSEEQAAALSSSMNISLAEAVERVALARLQEKQAGFREGSEGWQAIQKEIDARKELMGLIGNKSAREANAEAAKKAADEWQRTAEDINRSLTDALMRGFESGKDFARNLRDTIVNMFKTLVLRPVISAIVNPVAGAITGALGLAGAANAGQSALSTVGSIGSIGSGFSLLAGLGNFGGGLAGGLSGLMGSLGLSATGATIGGAMSAGGIALQAGNIAGGLGTIAGALGPIAIGIALLSSFIKKSTPHMGAASSYSAAGGLTSGVDVYRASGLADTRTYSADAEKVTATVAQSIAQALDSTAVAFGKKAGYEISTAFADDKSKDGAWGSLIIKQMGEAVLNWQDTQTSKWAPKEFADGEAGAKEYQQALAKSVREVIDGMGLPEWAARITRALPDSATMDDLTAALAQVKAYPAQLLQQFGTTRDAMVQQFAQGLATGDAASAGQAVADTLVASIQNAVFTNAAGQIFDIVNQGIVTPMLDAIATGASVADALSQATIDKTIERAKAQAQALAELYGNADFAAAMEQLRTAVGGALGQAGGYLQTLPQTLVTTQQIDTAAQDAARAAEEAQRAWQQITDGLLADQAALQIDLLRAQGREEEALARERALAIEGMDAYQTALYDSNRALRSQIDTLRELGELLPAVIDQYLTPEQRTSNAYSGIASDLVGAGLSGMGAADLAQALVGASKGEIAEAATAIYQMTGVTDEMRVALLRAAGSLATLKDEAASVADAGLDSGYAALERAVQARRSVVQDTVNEVRAVFDTVRSAARDLFGEVDSVVQFNAQAGRAYITQALGAARSTGYLPDGEQLSEAIRAARAGLQGQVFASQAEADYQKLVLANELKALQDISGDQLTEAEQQLKALDGILDSAREQIDALRGIDNSVMSVEAALAAFGDALLIATGKSPAAAKAAGTAAGAAGMPDWATFGVGDWMTSSTGSLVFDNSTGMLYGQGDVTSHRSQLRDAAAALLEAGQSQALYDQVKASGFTLDQADTILGLPAGEAEKWARSLGLPVFHDGTPYVPRTGFAVLEQGEAVIPRAFNHFTGGGSAVGNTERLERLVEAMASELAQMRAQLDEANRHAARTADATNGRPEAPVLVEVVA